MMDATSDPGPAIDALSPHDAAAVDALIAAGLNPDLIGEAGTEERARAKAAASLLGLLECRAYVDPALADVAFHRVLQVRRATVVASADPELTEDDRAALDAWVMQGYDAQRVPASLRDRARRHQALAALVTTSSIGSDPTLVDRTLDRIESEVESQRIRLNVETARRAPSLRVRLADVVSVAAVLLVSAGVLMPVMTAVREQSRRGTCDLNLHNTAVAMGAYAGSYRDSLPVTTASLGSGKWWEVGKPHSNSANLFTLARTGYTPLNSLACPGNSYAVTGEVDPKATDWRSLDEISYSYQVMYGRERPLWASGKRAVVLADRSPVVPRSVRGEQFNPMDNAPNHRRKGQHLLYNDGSVEWVTSPMLKSGDNIWLTRAVELRVDFLAGRPLRPLNGTEIPDAADDAFLGP